jgi:hypothetical protein
VSKLLAPRSVTKQQTAISRALRRTLAPTKAERALAWANEHGPVVFARAIPHQQPELLAYARLRA